MTSLKNRDVKRSFVLSSINQLYTQRHDVSTSSASLHCDGVAGANYFGRDSRARSRVVLRQGSSIAHLADTYSPDSYITAGLPGASGWILADLGVSQNYPITANNSPNVVIRVDRKGVLCASGAVLSATYEVAEEFAEAESYAAATEPAVVEPDPLSSQSIQRVNALMHIQSAFGLTIRDLAKILNVSPPQIYRWLDVEDNVRLSARSLNRLEDVHSLADYWSDLTSVPLASASRDPGSLAREAIELLFAPELDSIQVKESFKRQVDYLTNRPKSISERMRSRGIQPRSRSRFSDDD